MTLPMRMGVVPEQPWRMIAWNLNRVVQNLAGFSQHREHIILRGIRGHGEPMKVQVRHVHARIHRTGLSRPERKIVDVRDSQSVTGRSADDWRHRLSVESEGIPAVFVDGIEPKGYNMILSPHLRWLRH